MKTRRAAWALLVLLMFASVSWAQIGRFVPYRPPVYTPPPLPPGGAFGNSGIDGIDLPGSDGIDFPTNPPVKLNNGGDEFPYGGSGNGSRRSSGGSRSGGKSTSPANTNSTTSSTKPAVEHGGGSPPNDSYQSAVVDQDDEEEEVDSEYDTGDAYEAEEIPEVGANEADDASGGEWTWFGRIGAGIAILGLMSFVGAMLEGF